MPEYATAVSKWTWPGLNAKTCELLLLGEAHAARGRDGDDVEHAAAETPDLSIVGNSL